MKRPEFLQRLREKLPGGDVRETLPSVWAPGDESEPASPPPDTDEPMASPPPADTDEPATVPPDGVEPAEFDDAIDQETEDEKRNRIRTVLLGFSAFGAALAVGAAVARRLLGRGEESEDVVEAEVVESEPAEPLEEGTAAALGLAFLLLVEAVRDRLTGSTA